MILCLTNSGLLASDWLCNISVWFGLTKRNFEKKILSLYKSLVLTLRDESFICDDQLKMSSMAEWLITYNWNDLKYIPTQGDVYCLLSSSHSQNLMRYQIFVHCYKREKSSQKFIYRRGNLIDVFFQCDSQTKKCLKTDNDSFSVDICINKRRLLSVSLCKPKNNTFSQFQKQVECLYVVSCVKHSLERGAH